MAHMGTVCQHAGYSKNYRHLLVISFCTAPIILGQQNGSMQLLHDYVIAHVDIFYPTRGAGTLPTDVLQHCCPKP